MNTNINPRKFARVFMTTFFVFVILYAMIMAFSGLFRLSSPAHAETSSPNLEESLGKESDLLLEYRKKKLERSEKAKELSGIETDVLDLKSAIQEQRAETDKVVNEGLEDRMKDPARLVPVQEESPKL